MRNYEVVKLEKKDNTGVEMVAVEMFLLGKFQKSSMGNTLQQLYTFTSASKGLLLNRVSLYLVFFLYLKNS